jgi:hypothetical protein
MTVRTSVSFLVLLLIACGATSAAATTVPSMSPSQLIEAADIVVDGVVIRSETRWVGQRIITFLTVLSGAGPSLTSTQIAVPGGVVGTFAQVVPGTPKLEVGGRYRFYLGAPAGPRLDGGGPTRGIVGLFRGVFAVDDLGRARPFGEDGLPVVVR